MLPKDKKKLKKEKKQTLTRNYRGKRLIQLEGINMTKGKKS